jgi:hypothetical protein
MHLETSKPADLHYHSASQTFYTDQFDNCFKSFSTLFRVGDYAIRQCQNRLDSDYFILVNSDDPFESSLDGPYDSLGLLLAAYSPDVAASLQSIVSQNEKSFLEEGDGTDLDYARIAIRRAEIAFALQLRGNKDPIHWDTLKPGDLKTVTLINFK